MSPEPDRDEDAIYKLTWAVLIVGAILVASAVVWRHYSKPPAAPVAPAEPVAVNAATEAPVEEPAQLMVPRPTPSPTRMESHILDRDPDAIRRQSEWLRRQAAAAKDGSSRLTLTEERIRTLEKNKELLQ